MNQYDNFIGPRRNWLPAGNRELIFGLLAVILGLFAANMVIFGGFRLGFAMAGVLSVALTWGYLYRSGCKGNGYTTAILVLCIIIAAGFGWSADSFVKSWMLLFLLAGTNLAFCLMAGHNRFAPGSARSLFDAARTLFYFGIGRIGYAARGVAMAFRSGGALTQRSGAVLAGLGIAVPALAVVIPLLISSDAAFEGLIDLLPDFDLFEIFTTVLFGTALGLFFYSRAVALRHEEPTAQPVRETRRLHVITMNTALGAVCIVYIAYLFSQLAYFVGGFSGILPEGYTRAEYARRGFFEMTWLVAINLALMTFGVSKVQRETRAPGSTRAMCLFLGLVSEFPVAASGAKMVMYIGTFGLTRLRVLTEVIMVFMALTTLVVSCWLFLPKIPYMKVILVIGLIMGAAVAWADVDTVVAKYNVEAYQSGKLETVDVEYLSELGYGAVPYIAQLKNDSDPKVSGAVWNILLSRYAYGCSGEIADFRFWNYAHAVADSYLPPPIVDAYSTD